jgi:hypothetical protein
LVRLQVVVLGMQTFERLLAVLGEVWSANGCHCPGEESWLPLLVGFLSLRGLSPLRLFDLGLEVGGNTKLFAYYSIRDAVPELERLIRKLLFERWYDLRDGVERVEVNDGDLLLSTRKFLPWQ